MHACEGGTSMQAACSATAHTKRSTQAQHSTVTHRHSGGARRKQQGARSQEQAARKEQAARDQACGLSGALSLQRIRVAVRACSTRLLPHMSFARSAALMCVLLCVRRVRCYVVTARLVLTAEHAAPRVGPLISTTRSVARTHV